MAAQSTVTPLPPRQAGLCWAKALAAVNGRSEVEVISLQAHGRHCLQQLPANGRAAMAVGLRALRALLGEVMGNHGETEISRNVWKYCSKQ